MGVKHVLVLLAIILMVIWTVRYRRGLRRKIGTGDIAVRSLAGTTTCIGLVIGYLMMIIRLLYEAVDHAL